MGQENHAVYLRRRILADISTLTWEGRLAQELNKLPVRLAPSGTTSYRCCLHHDRAVLKDRTIASLGMRVEERDEDEELNEFARRALESPRVEAPYLTVLQEACKACVQSHYFVTNACQGCVARPCTKVCPRNCITLTKGKAEIDGVACVNCGKCPPVCPYHAIIYVPIPCEESCPVDAIAKDDKGKETIDKEKCIHCGKCIRACPFGAIMECSQIVSVIQLLKTEQPVVALLAPAVAAQYSAERERILGAVKALGFDQVLEAAEGADLTARDEALEWRQRLESGQKFMTSSCCPSWVACTRTALPAVAPYVSHTPSPMVMSSRLAQERFPDHRQVFIGPCVAKRAEAREHGIEHVLSFEELDALFQSKGIQPSTAEPLDPGKATDFGRGFASSGGVTAALKETLAANAQPGPELQPELVNGLTRKAMNLMKVYAMGKGKGNFVEVMVCEGGCTAGPGVITEK